jgi:glutaconate CoA-transferase subunit B
VRELEFITSMGHGRTGRERRELGVRTKGPTRLITDLCVFEPDPETREMSVVSMHAGVTREKIQENTGWPVRYAADVSVTPEPAAEELDVLRDIQARTKKAHGGAA